MGDDTDNDEKHSDTYRHPRHDLCRLDCIIPSGGGMLCCQNDGNQPHSDHGAANDSDCDRKHVRGSLGHGLGVNSFAVNDLRYHTGCLESLESHIGCFGCNHGHSEQFFFFSIDVHS
jgi:hypothetical protein